MSGDVFDQLPLFEGLDCVQRALLKQIFIPCDYYPNTMIFAQGDLAEFLYLVVLGEVVVNFKPDDGRAGHGGEKPPQPSGAGRSGCPAAD